MIVGVAILSDEIYSQMLYNGRKHVSLLQYPEIRDRLIVLDGWSKTYAMTGWRMGYAVWPDQMVDQVTRLCINDHSCVNAAAQYAGLAALTGPEEPILRMVSEFDTRRKVIVSALNGLKGVSCIDSAGAFYAFPNVSGTGMNGSEFAKKCMHEAGVAIVPGTAFGKTSTDYVRFSFAASKENIQKALEKIKKMLE